MKRIVTIIGICLGCFTSQAQERPVSVVEAFKGLTHCVDIEVAAMGIVPEFYKNKQFDSIALTLDYLATVCIEIEALRITRFLLEMEQGTFNDSMITSRDIYLINLEARQISFGKLYDFGHLSRGANYESSNFAKRADNHVVRIAIERSMIGMIYMWRSRLLQRGGLTQTELSILYHIRTKTERPPVGKNLFYLVNKPAYRGSRIRKEYDYYHSNYRLNNALHFQLSYSHWFSTGPAASFFGSQPGVYLSLGGLFKRYNRIDFFTAIRFGNAKTAYPIVRPDTSFFSKRGYITLMGFDYTRTLWRPSRRFDVGVSAGVGAYQRRFFELLPQDSDIEDEVNDLINAKMGKEYHNRAFFSAGLEFKYFIRPSIAINFNPKCVFPGNVGSAIGNSSNNGNMLLLNLGMSFFLAGQPSRRDTNFWNIVSNK